MSFPLIFKALRDRWRGVIFWILGTAGLAGMELYVFPSVKETSGQMDAFIKALPEAFVAMFGMQDYSSPAGFLGTELFSIVVPLVYISIGASWAAAATADEEERGTADILFALPIRRWRILTSKLIAMILVLAILSVAIWATIRFGGELVDLQIADDHLWAILASCFGLALVFGGISLLFATASSKRGVAMSATIGLAVLGFLLYSLAPLVKELDDTKQYNPYQWALGEKPLVNGFDWVGLEWLGATALVCFVISGLILHRRDIGN